MHSGDSLVGPAEAWHESCLPLGGEGCPEVAEFAVVEFAAALGRSTESGRRYLARAVEGCYRLPRCWARAGGRSSCRRGGSASSPNAPCASPRRRRGSSTPTSPRWPTRSGRAAGPAGRGGQGPVRPRPDRGRTTAAAETRHLDVDLAQVASTGTVHVEGDLDLADAFDLDAAVAADAHAQLPSAPPSPWTSAAPSRPATWPAASCTLDLRPATDQPRPRCRPAGRAARPPRATPRSAAPAGWPGSRRSPVRSPPSRSGCGAATPTRQVTVNRSSTWPSTSRSMSYEASDRLKAQTTCAT